MSRPDLKIGTSGWNYPHWKGRFYPESQAKVRWLEYYGSRFDEAVSCCRLHCLVDHFIGARRTSTVFPARPPLRAGSAERPTAFSGPSRPAVSSRT